MPKLSPSAARAAIRRLLDPEKLGGADRKRIEAIGEVLAKESSVLADFLAASFPDLAGEKALSAFTSFRKRINDAAAGFGIPLRLEVDLNKRDPQARRCWFAGEDPTAEQMSSQATQDVDVARTVKARAIATTGGALASGKRSVNFFISYAHKDEQAVNSLLDHLAPHFKISRKYALNTWSDKRILPGEKWDEEIQAALQTSDFGLAFVSPEFFASEYIRGKELPKFLGDESPKPVIPVGVVPVDFRLHDLGGLEERQIFRQGGKWYNELAVKARKQDFTLELYRQIEARLDKHFTRTPAAGSAAARIADGAFAPDAVPHYQRGRAKSVRLQELERLGDRQVTEDEGVDALTELEAWARHAQAPPFFAVLGEYGIGKTTLLKQFTRRLIERRRTEPALPLPVYIDLRNYVRADHGKVPTVEGLLDSILKRSWKLEGPRPTPGDLLRLVREEGAIIIFDGLDEQIVHLTQDEARQFIRTLWSALPQAAPGAEAPLQRGKLIISCRSHYFRDILSQNAMLCGEDREGIGRTDFPALCLLPFREEQIRGYLKGLLGSEERAADALALIGRIRNLRELVKRPYLLSLIATRLHDLEALRVKGKPLNAARLYDLVVHSWLNRDDGKHQLDVRHKRRMMEDLAAAMWRGGDKSWDVDRLEEWFERYLADDSMLREFYRGRDWSVLKEDLRTATFVLRPDQEQREFRFAHTSLQEFFLASYLARALGDDPDRWALPQVSRETWRFCGELLSLLGEAERTRALKRMEELLSGRAGTPGSLNAFGYWMLARAEGLPQPYPQRVALAHADLSGWRLTGPLNLRGADLMSARLNEARLEEVDLSGAVLRGVQARGTVLIDVNAANADLSEADLRGVRWRGGSLESATLQGAKLDGCQWIEVSLQQALLPRDWDRGAAAASIAPAAAGGQMHLALGHSAFVLSCAWSADGVRLASAGFDGTVRVWDAATGECVRTLAGHSGVVWSCAWSADGVRLASAGEDGTVRVWDAATGECIRMLTGHSPRVHSCAWNADGARLASAGADGTVRVWDAVTGECVRTLTGHSDWVHSCAWSADGVRLASAGEDGTVRVWDAVTGDCVRTLTGHSGTVRSCAWSVDGVRLASAGVDGTVRVWDAATGDCVRTLTGHSGTVRSCAWNVDGVRLASTGSDGTVRVWDAATGECMRALTGHSPRVHSCAWNADGVRLASAGEDGTVRVWDAATGECVRTLPGHSGVVNSSAWRADGVRLASAGEDGTVRVWDAATGECVRTLARHSDWVMSCAWNADGLRLASAGEDRTVRVWDAATGECVRTLAGHTGWVRSCAWNPDGVRLASAGDDATVRVWDAATGRCVRTLTGHSGGVNSCAWTADGVRLASAGSDGTICVWDAATGECVRRLAGHTGVVMSCTWSPEGGRLLSASQDGRLRVWDAATGECVQKLSVDSGGLRSCAWNPDGVRLASATSDGTVRVWDAATGECVRTLTGHSGMVNSCAWSADGVRLASAGEDGTVRVWDAATGEPLYTIHSLPEGHAATISAAGKVLWASPEAWRWLAWRWRDPRTGRLRLLPAEHFGPLPGLPAPRS